MANSGRLLRYRQIQLGRVAELVEIGVAASPAERGYRFRQQGQRLAPFRYLAAAQVAPHRIPRMPCHPRQLPDIPDTRAMPCAKPLTPSDPPPSASVPPQRRSHFAGWVSFMLPPRVSFSLPMTSVPLVHRDMRRSFEYVCAQDGVQRGTLIGEEGLPEALLRRRQHGTMRWPLPE